jgi:hypothetical protein
MIDDFRDAVERACDAFDPVRDYRTSPQSAVTFTRFRDGHDTEIRIHLSSAAMRECCWVSLEFPAGRALGPAGAIVDAPSRTESLHLCRCMAAELRAALDRAFDDTLDSQPRCEYEES